MFHFANAVIMLSKSNRISLCASEKISAFSLSSAIVDLRSYLFQQFRKYLVLVLKLDNFNHYWKGVLYISINCLMGVDGLLLESVQILFNTLVCDWNYLLHPTHYQRKLIYLSLCMNKKIYVTWYQSPNSWFVNMVKSTFQMCYQLIQVWYKDQTLRILFWGAFVIVSTGLYHF